jgi:methylmalonyl-CoA/ethylmalonyl-CoA epimerase
MRFKINSKLCQGIEKGKRYQKTRHYERIRQGEKMVFEKIERIVVGVRDLDLSIEFFSGLLGISFDEPFIVEGQNIRAVYSSFGLELVESVAPDSMIDRFINKRGEGVFGIVIKVTDMDKAVKILEQKGIRLTGEIQIGAMKEVTFHPKDTFGCPIGLAAYQAKHPATVAASQEAPE